MKTYTTLRNLYGTLTRNTQTAALTVGDQFINDSIRTINNLRGGKWWFLERTREIQTIAGERSYEVPDNFRKIQDLYVTVGTTVYMPEAVFDPVHWKLILAYQLGTSDIPMFYYREGNKLHFAPIPASDGNVITVRGRLTQADLSIADYTTGTITSVPYTTTFTAIVASGATSATLSAGFAFTTGDYQITFSSGEIRMASFTSASTAVTWDNELTEAATATITISTSTGGSIITASGTTFTADMVGRFIRITETTAAGGGDGLWYEIGTYFDSTHIALVKAYLGTSLSGATASYTIGQVPLIPEAYQIAIIWRSVAMYWDSQGELGRSERYWRMYDGGVEAGFSKSYGGIIGQMLENEGETVEGAYIPPFASTSNVVNTGAWWSPWQSDASGF